MFSLSPSNSNIEFLSTIRILSINFLRKHARTTLQVYHQNVSTIQSNTAKSNHKANSASHLDPREQAVRVPSTFKVIQNWFSHLREPTGRSAIWRLFKMADRGQRSLGKSFRLVSPTFRLQTRYSREPPND